MRVKSGKKRLMPWDSVSKYGSYDTSTGMGTPEEWKSIFDEVWSHQNCIDIIKEDSPLGILGLTLSATWEQIKSAYRSLILINHPDKGGDLEKCKKINAAYSLLKEQHGK